MHLPDFHVHYLSPDEMVGLVQATALLVLIFLFWFLADLLRARTEEQRRLLDIVNEHATRAGLTPEEKDLLTRMAMAEGIFPGIQAFEREVENLLDRGESAETIKNLRFKLGFNIPRSGHRLYSTRECEVGQDVTVCHGERVSSGSVFEVDERYLLLRIPDEAAADLKPGAEICVSFWRAFDAHYDFTASVHDLRVRPLPLVNIAHPHALNRKQDRDFIRADIRWETHAFRLTDDHFPRPPVGDGTAERPEGEPMNVTVVDISEGGARLLPFAGVEAGDHMLLEIPLADRRVPLRALASVIEADAGGVRCRFAKLSMNEKDEIHRALLRMMR